MYYMLSKYFIYYNYIIVPSIILHNYVQIHESTGSVSTLHVTRLLFVLKNFRTNIFLCIIISIFYYFSPNLTLVKTINMWFCHLTLILLEPKVLLNQKVAIEDLSYRDFKYFPRIVYIPYNVKILICYRYTFTMCFLLSFFLRLTIR